MTKSEIMLKKCKKLGIPVRTITVKRELKDFLGLPCKAVKTKV